MSDAEQAILAAARGYVTALHVFMTATAVSDIYAAQAAAMAALDALVLAVDAEQQAQP